MNRSNHRKVLECASPLRLSLGQPRPKRQRAGAVQDAAAPKGGSKSFTVGCRAGGRRSDKMVTELLILPDGRILAHNLTQPMATLLRKLNPEDDQIASRVPRFTHHVS